MEFPASALMFSDHAVVLILATIGIGYLGGAIAELGKVGVAVGQLGDNLPPPNETVALLLKYNIQRVRIYNTNASLLSAFSGSGIEVTVQVLNEEVGAVASNMIMGHDSDGNEILFAEKWILDNISPHVRSGTTITEILVGNEWLGNPNTNYNASWLVPALYNIHAALQTADPEVCKLNITVTTPHTFAILNVSFPPSKGTFDPKYHSVLRGVLGFLLENQPGPAFQINIFPYFAYRNNPNVSLAYATFQNLVPVIDPNTHLSYFNILDAQLDAVHFAIDALLRVDNDVEAKSFSQPMQSLTLTSSKHEQNVPTHPAESGWAHDNKEDQHSSPSHGMLTISDKRRHVSHTSGYVGHRRARPASPVDCKCGGGASIKNAQTYNQNSIIHVLKSTGTPAVPNQPLSLFVFALFDENQKSGDATERNYGIFYPNKTPVYHIDFNPSIARIPR